ncbi:MAG: DUF2892 domain-containing protein [Thiomargarita sp.]|nr:DUF2892 domain-containing protein [Thiomargarita sp.]
MIVNVGTIDRIIRVIIGMGMFGAGMYYQNWWGLIGLMPVFTAAFGFCPAYFPFGFSTTCKTKAN